METRANHLIIGVFVLMMIVAGFGFVIWLARIDYNREFDYYAIYFAEAVTGLSVGGDVRYGGVPVGRVTGINIDPRDPRRVRVVVEVASDTPVRADTVAQLEYQGITGVTFIQLTGGSPDAPLLEQGEPGELPVIASDKSALQELFAGAPELINRVIVLVDRLSGLVDEDNRAAVASILRNAETVSSGLAARMPQVEEILLAMQRSSRDVEQTIAGLNSLVERMNSVAGRAEQTLTTAEGALATADQLLDRDVRSAVGDFKRAVASYEQAGKELEALLSNNRAPLSAFASEGLVEFTRFVEESRLLVASLSRMVERIESDPSQFIFGGRGGFEADR